MSTLTTRIETTLANTKPLALAAAIQRGIDAWAEAGKILVTLLDEDHMTLDEIANQSESDFITPEVLAQFERIGRGQVLPALLAAQYPAAPYLERLPMSLQVQATQTGVELLVIHNGQTDTLSVAARHLTKKQCRQVFERNAIRSLAAQRAWLEDQAASTPQPIVRATAAWTVKGHEVLVNRPCALTKADLLTMLQQLR